MGRLDWDPVKARGNLRKHGVTFEEAETVLSDRGRLEVSEEDVVTGELRVTAIGWSAAARLLVVVTSDDGRRPTRLISARRASKRERHAYERRR